MSLLEAVLAMAILGIVVSALMGSMGFVHGRQMFERRELASAELAHRLIMQYLDDARALSAIRGQPIQYGNDFYQWDMQVRPVDVRNRVSNDESKTAARFETLLCVVWLAPQSGGAAAPGPGVPRAELRRVYDPLPLRNPESMKKLLDSEEGIRDLIETLGQ